MEYGLIGYPLKHSFSKEIHTLIKEYLHIDSYDYELKELKEEELDLFFKNKKFKAINVTIPYKEKVIKYLDYIDPNAESIGAINTIVNKNGRLYGYNTDYLGMMALIKENSIEIKNRKVLILGTGGTSKTAYLVAKNLGAACIVKASRKKVEKTLDYREIYEKYSDVEIIINTTPVGMYPNNDDVLIDFTKLNKINAYIDVIYNPINTKMAILARNNNIKAVNGLYMLVSQAIYAFCYFKDLQLDDNKIAAITSTIYKNILKNKLNIALIGMPTSGKTTIGGLLAKDLNKEFIDTDDLIKKEINMEIKDYINKFGEDKFREIETKIIKEVSKKQNQVIATGGGCILRNENILLLHQNSKIYFINRSLDNLQISYDRPLSASLDDLKKRYDERIDLYLRYNDKEIDGNKNIEEVKNAIMEDYNG